MSDSIQIKVQTNEIRQIATELENKIKESKNTFDELQKITNGVVNYWEGMGEEAHINAYKRVLDTAGPYIQAFFDSVNNLRTVAGIYEVAEKENIDAVDELPTDVID